MKDEKEKAEYCLNCKMKQCQKACPLGNNIPDFIKSVKDNNFEQAYKILSRTTILQSVCGRICPHLKQCMGSCTRGIKGDPVSIGDLEAYVGDLALKNNYEMEQLDKDCVGKKVAVIGSGPSGLTCSAFLARRGAEVTIYEKREKLGGILRYGIPNFRLDKEILNSVINKILSLGIKTKTHMELEQDIFIDDIQKEYDAIFLSFGANIPLKMKIKGENLEGVFGANLLLESGEHPNYNQRKVVIIGGGNVAIDSARTVKRLGAKDVTVIYRRSEEEMPAERKEIEDAKKDGVRFLFQTNILKIIGNKKVEKIECIKTKLVKQEGIEMLIPINIENSNFLINIDYVIMAIGAKPDSKIISKLGLETNTKGYIMVNENFETSNKKIFAGGDLVGIKQTVAYAAYSGRKAADIIAKKLKFT